MSKAAEPLPQGFQPASAGPDAPAPVAFVAGDSASTEAMARLKAAVAELKSVGVRPLLDQSMAALRRNDWLQAGQWAIKALEVDETNGVGWWLLAIAREKAGDFRGAISCFEAALKLLPEHRALANDLGRLAFRLKMPEMAEKLFAHFLLHQPGHPEGTNNLACALRDQRRFAEAIEVIRPVLYANPGEALLWNTLGTVMNEQGEVDQSLTFYDEALRLDPAMATARYNRGNARLSTGDPAGALEDVETALTRSGPAELPMMRLARALALLASGRLDEAWEDYEVRLDPGFPNVTRFMIDRPRWAPEAEVAGRRVLVVGEQGLGDEIMFGSMLPDLAAEIGAEGALVLAVEPRLVPLFQRSFPEAEVGAHATYKVDGHTVRFAPAAGDLAEIDLWTPMACLARRYRREPEAFGRTPSFLKADPERVAHWKRELAALGDGPKIGLLWKSLQMTSSRSRFFSPFEQWGAVLATPGCVFVNLQYGECGEELEQARAAGTPIWSPPGLDLKNDLDEVAALACALDLTLGPPNATSNIAAACGAPAWVISTPGAWPRLGSDHMPWYPAMRVFTPASLSDWGPVMADVSAALRGHFGL
jgi:tetratricopeptide (TPR) repeat protein